MGAYCVFLWTQNTLVDHCEMWIRWMFCKNYMENRRRLDLGLRPISLSE